MHQYNHQKIEAKWQKKWAEQKIYQVKENYQTPKTKRRYVLDMFPYPSGAGLHVGHVEGYSASDIYARYLRMKGYQVLHPMGWDAFGLPTENYALKVKTNPKIVTRENTNHFREQCKMMGFSYDWSREINTSDPKYYKWTQWLFLLLYKRGLAYKKKAPVNWCESCKTVLAREQVVDGKCERCKKQVIQKELSQWFFKITNYAERLLSDLDQLDWPEPIKLMQRNWIGKSEGAVIKFKVQSPAQTAGGSKFKVAVKNLKFIEVFTTRPDTIFGATYLVVAPEHPLITNYELRITNFEEVKRYIDQSRHKTELERTDLAKEKNGAEIKGFKAINPATGEAIPVWIADYVLMSYGTGAIMAVPAHDKRDFEFAQKYKLPIKQVICYNLDDYNDTLKTLTLLSKINQACQKQGVKFWLLGGLACAFYAQVIYRRHNDLDLLVKTQSDLKKMQLILENLGFKKEEEKEIIYNKTKSFNLIYKNINGQEVEFRSHRKGFDCQEEDLEEALKYLNNFSSRVLSLEYIKKLKQYLLNSRNKEKDKTDWEFLNGKVIDEDGFLINSQPKNPEKNSGSFDGSTRIEIALNFHQWQGYNNNIQDKKKNVKTYNGVAPAPGFAPSDPSLPKVDQHYAADTATPNLLYQDRKEDVKINFNGMSSEKAKNKIVEWLAKKGLAKKSVQYKLRDWLISRQRYWGAPIPISYCETCGEIEEDFLKNIKWLLQKVDKNNFETLNISKAIGRLSQNVCECLKGQGDLVYLNSYVLGKLRGWFRKFRGHKELPLDFYFLLPQVIYAPRAIYQDKSNPAIYHFTLRLPRHHFNVVIDVERIEGRNEITTLFIARDGYFKKFKVIKKESSRGPATSPSCLPSFKTRNGGSGISTLCKNSYQYYKCFGKKSQEVLYKRVLKPVSIPVNQLPILLPDDVDFRPTGESPLVRSKSFHQVKCPKCGADARRESDTMDCFVCSSWYFLRYSDPHNEQKFCSDEKIKYWCPVDVYIGGAEHAVMHLLYARFITKVLKDAGYVNFNEPFIKLRNQGLILAEDGRKMSKSLGNVINPDEVVKKYGADTLRMFEMFLGPLEEAKPWDTKSIKGIRRFLEKVYNLYKDYYPRGQAVTINHDLDILYQETVKKVSEDIEKFSFNTAIAQLMIFIKKYREFAILFPHTYSPVYLNDFIKLLAPFAPHIAEEIYHEIIPHHKSDPSLFLESWPDVSKEEDYSSLKVVKVVIQINGKKRDDFEIFGDADFANIYQNKILKQAKNRPRIQKWIKNKEITREIYKNNIESVLINFVI